VGEMGHLVFVNYGDGVGSGILGKTGLLNSTGRVEVVYYRKNIRLGAISRELGSD